MLSCGHSQCFVPDVLGSCVRKRRVRHLSCGATPNLYKTLPLSSTDGARRVNLLCSFSDLVEEVDCCNLSWTTA